MTATAKFRCPACGTVVDIPVTNAIDGGIPTVTFDELDWADLWAHIWSHKETQ